MSRYLKRKVDPYVPGEQPGGGFLKLNTNESPFPPSPHAISYAADSSRRAELYPDPECKALANAAARVLGVRPENLVFADGSDAILNYAFAAYCSEGERNPVFADLTYGFYKTLTGFYGVEAEIIPLREDFTVDIDAFEKSDGVIFLPNPNAPTGLALPLCDIERIVSSREDRIVVIDEAYVDFGTESAVSLIGKYNNLIVTRTFSKSRSLAGARLGFAVADAELIEDLNAVKYSLDPYCVTSHAMAAGIGSLADNDYFEACRERIIESRAYTMEALRELGFFVTDSAANFVFARCDRISGAELCRALRGEKILVRHFGGRAEDFVRITVGKKSDMKRLISAVERILS